MAPGGGVLLGWRCPSMIRTRFHGPAPHVDADCDRRIPKRYVHWYYACMTTQIAVRLPDRMVEFLDRSVAAGAASSRAALVGIALEREMRRQAALTDAETLRAAGAGDDLDDLVAWSAGRVAIDD